MRFMRLVPIITGASTGRQPPLRPVPAPRGTKAMLLAVQQTEDLRHLRRRARQHDDLGRALLQRVAVALVDAQLRRPGDDPVVAGNGAQGVEDAGREHRHHLQPAENEHNRLVANDPIYEVLPAHLEMLTARGFTYEIVRPAPTREKRRAAAG